MGLGSLFRVIQQHKVRCRPDRAGGGGVSTGGMRSGLVDSQVVDRDQPPPPRGMHGPLLDLSRRTTTDRLHASDCRAVLPREILFRPLVVLEQHNHRIS